MPNKLSSATIGADASYVRCLKTTMIRCLPLAQAGKSQYRGQSLRRTKPVAFDRVATCLLGSEPRRNRDDENVISVTQNRDEVRNHINGKSKVKEKNAEPYSHAHEH